MVCFQNSLAHLLTMSALFFLLCFGWKVSKAQRNFRSETSSMALLGLLFSRRSTGTTRSVHLCWQCVIAEELESKKCGILGPLYGAPQTSKLRHCLTTKCITSPQEQKTNNFHQIDLDANVAATNGGK